MADIDYIVFGAESIFAKNFSQKNSLASPPPVIKYLKWQLIHQNVLQKMVATTAAQATIERKKFRKNICIIQNGMIRKSSEGDLPEKRQITLRRIHPKV